MGKKRKADIPVTPSSGNVFADLGFPEPEKTLAEYIAALPAKERAKVEERAAALLNARQARHPSELTRRRPRG